jgi:hypothetical protein
MQNERPLYRLQIDEQTGKLVYMISLVESPAVESDFIYFNSVETFAKDDEKMEMIGIAMKCDTIIPRQGFDVVFTKDEVRKIAQSFMRNGFQNNTNLQHKDIPADCFIYQSYIVDSKLGIQAPKHIKDAKDGDWIVGMKCNNPDTWKKIKSGEVKGYSIEGAFEKEIFEKIDDAYTEQKLKDLITKFKNKIK